MTGIASQTISPYGFWPSDITADTLTQQSMKLSEPQLCNGELFWIETRPTEKGRNVLLKQNKAGIKEEVLPAPHNVRTRANEYGGGSYLATDDVIICVLDSDQRVYCFDRSNQSLCAISPENPQPTEYYRYADFCFDAKRQRIICVQEYHHPDNRMARCDIVALAIYPPYRTEMLVSGDDFYSNPRVNPNNDKLSYLAWNHPQMPWDGTQCYCATIESEGRISTTELIAGGRDESIFQPQWSPSGELFLVSDKNNWWNIYRANHKTLTPICEMNAEFATPQWVFGMSTYGFLDAQTILCCYTQMGVWQLAKIDLMTGRLQLINTEFCSISSVHCHNQEACFIAASQTQSAQLFLYNKAFTAIANTSALDLSIDDISLPQPIQFETSDKEIAHAFYYPPTNKQVQAPTTTLPPLIVMCHGGPTGATDISLNIKTQFWTQRGFAVLDINYRGSTGYGREYRDKLKHNWGVTDVIDAASGAQYLIERGLVDKQKIAIRGSSAGGYTVLAALTFTDVFRAGASLYGIGDLAALARDTHKFEAHYLDGLVGEYPKDEAIYHARSPIFHIEKLNCPVIFFQGLKDNVVPPAQAEAMVNALRKKNIRAEYITFADEGHGFRQAKNIKQAIDTELAFYQSLFQH